jgi:hypothetical protein
MSIKRTSHMPESGQFVAVWEYNYTVWSMTLKWEDGMLCRYSRKRDKFKPLTPPYIDLLERPNSFTRYFHR